MNQNTTRRVFVRILLGLSGIATPFAMLATAADTVYNYDALGRLTTVTRSDGTVTTYTLDAAGNRTQVQESGPVSAVPSINVPGSSATGSYLIEWTAPAAGTVDRYELYEDTSPSFGAANRIYNSLAPRSLAVTGRVNGSYYYRVRACGAINCGDYAVGGPAVVRLPPAAPASISISSPSNNGSFSISWGAVTSGTATRYELWQANNAGYSGEAKAYDNSGLTALLSGRSQGSYWYRVRGCNVTSCGEFKQVSSPQIVDTTVPGLPQNVSAPTVAMSHAFFQWTAASDNYGVAGYDYKLSSQSTFTSVANVFTAAIANLSPLQNYTFEVRARDIAGNAGPVATTNFTTLAPPPLAPTGLARQLVASCAWTATWLASTHATYYLVKQTIGPNLQTGLLTQNVSCTPGNPESNMPLAVQACNGQGCSGDANFGVPVDNIKPSIPGTIVLGTIFPTSVTASWPASHDLNGIAGYEYSLNSLQFQPAGSSPSLNLTTLVESTPYTLVVRAFDPTGNRSDPSPAASFTTPMGPDTQPPGPTPNLERGTLTANSVRFDWGAATDNVGVVGYNYRLNNTSTWTIGNLNQFVQLNNLTMQTTYTFEVAARDGAGLVGPVSSNPFTTLLGVPSAPLNPSYFQDSQCSWRASWTPSNGATSYQVRDWSGNVTTTVSTPPAIYSFCSVPGYNGNPNSYRPRWVKACNTTCGLQANFP